MKILYVASEAAPFATSGGLGDVMSALPACVAQSTENKVEVILPLYSSIPGAYKEKLVHVMDFSFKLSWRETGASVYRYSDRGVDYLFVENHYYFDRSRFYGEFDDAERFAFFSKAVIEYVRQSGDRPDVIHANDWQSAMCVVYLKTLYAEDPAVSGIKTVFTIHNIEHQGKFDPYILGDVFGMGNEHLGLMEFAGCINLLKAALVSSDYITTVSPTYAKELEYDFYGFGLSGIIKSLSHKMSGVINGIDYNYFSPAGDKEIFKSYSARMVRSGKAKNKAELCAKLSLDTDEEIPLIVMITRLASQKGIDLFLRVAEEILSERVQVVILGTGEEKYENALRALEYKHNNFRALIQFDRRLSKQLYASADMFLMPSKFEPCGLAQMISCSYGTIPIVRLVGGLRDTILPYPCEGANGFGFSNYNAHEMLDTILYAINVYRAKDEWHALRRQAINSNFGWEISAANYITIYTNLLK